MSGLKRKSDELVDVEQSFAKLKSTVEKEIALKETNIKYKQQESVHRFIEKTSENRNKAESFYKKHFESSQTKLRSIKSTLAEAKKEEENIDSQLVKIAAIKNDAVDLQQFQESQLQLLWRVLNSEEIQTAQEKPSTKRRKSAKESAKEKTTKESKKD